MSPSASPAAATKMRAEMRASKMRAEKKWAKEMKNTVNQRAKVFPLYAKPGRDHISMKYVTPEPGMGEGLPTPSYMNKLIRSGLEFEVKEDDFPGNRYMGALRWDDVRGKTWSPMMKQTQDDKYDATNGFMVIGWRSIN